MLDIIVLLLFIYRFKIVQPQEKNYLILYSYTTASFLVALGFLHSRTNLSPFTKDFRGEDQYDEYLAIFPRSCFGEAAVSN